MNAQYFAPMPVVAHSERGLAIDVFGKNREFECDYYALEAGRISWVRRGETRYYDLEGDRMVLELEIDEPREIKMSPNGLHVGVLTSRNELVVFDEGGVRLRVRDISKFRMSNELLAYVSQSSFHAHRIGVDGVCSEPFHTSRISMLEFFVSGRFIFVATKRLEKDSQHKLLRIDGDAVDVLLSVDKLHGFSMKTHADGSHMLLLVMTSYVNNSYFPESDLYFHDAERGGLKRLECETTHYYTFMSRGFAVCHGPQPAEVTVYDLECSVSFRFPKGARNRVFFNQHENIVVFSGFDNLSGDIEVYDAVSRKLVSKFNVLGASLVNWKEDGSHFYVSTTSYFQEDNRITLYDYYGRVVDERRFESLGSVAVYGKTMPFVRLEQPSELIIESQKRYIPPSAAKAGSRKKSERTEKPKVDRLRVVEKTVSREEIVGELEEIRMLKDKMKTGEELSVKELNLILKEPRLASELRRFDK